MIFPTNLPKMRRLLIRSLWRLPSPFGCFRPSAVWSIVWSLDRRVKAEALISRRPAYALPGSASEGSNILKWRGRGSSEICAKRDSSVACELLSLFFCSKWSSTFRLFSMKSSNRNVPNHIQQQSSCFASTRYRPVCRLSGVDMILTNVLSPPLFFPLAYHFSIRTAWRGVPGNISPYFVTNFH